MNCETVKALAPRPLLAWRRKRQRARRRGGGRVAREGRRLAGFRAGRPLRRLTEQIRQRADRFEQSGGTSLPDPVRHGTAEPRLACERGREDRRGERRSDLRRAAGRFCRVGQVNLRLSPNLRGRGEVGMALMVDGRMANTVRISVI